MMRKNDTCKTLVKLWQKRLEEVERQNKSVDNPLEKVAYRVVINFLTKMMEELREIVERCKKEKCCEKKD